MNWIFWLIGLLLLGVAAYSIYRGIQNGKILTWATKFASRKIWKAIKPTVTTPLPADELEKRQHEYRRGNDDWLRKRQGSLKD